MRPAMRSGLTPAYPVRAGEECVVRGTERPLRKDKASRLRVSGEAELSGRAKTA